MATNSDDLQQMMNTFKNIIDEAKESITISSSPWNTHDATLEPGDMLLACATGEKNREKLVQEAMKSLDKLLNDVFKLLKWKHNHNQIESESRS